MFYQFIPTSMFHPQCDIPTRRSFRRCPRDRFGQMPACGFLQDWAYPVIRANHEERAPENPLLQHFEKLRRDLSQKTRQEQTGQECCQRKTYNMLKRETERKLHLAALDFHEFSPDDIKVKVADDSVIVRGRRQGPFGYCETTKAVPLPEDIKKSAVVCRFVDGHVIIELHQAGGKTSGQKSERTKPVEKNATQDKLTSSQSEDNNREHERKDQEAIREHIQNLHNVFSAIFGFPASSGQTQAKKDETENKGEELNKDEQKAEDKRKGDEKTPDSAEAVPHLSRHEDQKETTTDHMTDDVTAEGAIASGTTTEEATTSGTAAEEATTSGTAAEEATTSGTAAEEATTSGTTEQDDEQTCLVTTGDTRNTDDEFEHLDADTDDQETEDNSGAKIQVAETTETEDQVIVPEIQKYKVELDLSKFQPDDVRVVFSNGNVVVSGEREVKGDNYTEMEKWSRRIQIPKEVDASKLKSILDTEGIMTIEGPFHSDK